MEYICIVIHKYLKQENNRRIQFNHKLRTNKYAEMNLPTLMGIKVHIISIDIIPCQMNT